MVAGPQISVIVAEFEALFNPSDDTDNDTDGKQHKQTASWQRSFSKDVDSLVTKMEELGNPFLEHSKDLLTLDTQEIMPKNVMKSISKLCVKGQEQYRTFFENRL